ncbi:MAG: MotA/TolQ/ExbB proton channel family protein [Sphingomonadales bacterium]|nr:MotA/TolQ/ExbB proton channel family protein [Sphingomonadales bacterium]
MNVVSLLDPASAAIVVGGTLLATLLRCGLGDCALAISAIGQLGATRFDADEAKAELAVKVQQIQREGVLCVQPHHFGDRALDEATDRLIGTRSVSALLETHEAHKVRRMRDDNRAVRTLAQSAELAPVFGLAATLISLSQLPADGINRHAYMGAISMAVTATLYGIILANLVLAPLARAVERGAAEEETERQKIVDWLARQVAAAMPARKPTLVQAPGPKPTHEALSA